MVLWPCSFVAVRLADSQRSYTTVVLLSFLWDLDSFFVDYLSILVSVMLTGFERMTTNWWITSIATVSKQIGELTLRLHS